MIWRSPSTPRTTNHTTITGPNTREIVSVPRFCTTNSATRIATDTGITHDSNAVVATSKPSTALSTEIAGVIEAVPVEQGRAEHAEGDDDPLRADRQPRVGISSAVNARMPPSPWLSARITSSRYLIEMITIRAQNTTDATPYALALVTARSACSNDSRKAYSGLVPMSP